MQRGHNSRRDADPLLLDFIAVPLLFPLGHRLKVGVRRGKVSKRHIDIPVQRLFDAIRGGEIHVRYPHGQEPVFAELLFEAVPLERISTEPVDVFHIVISFLGK